MKIRSSLNSKLPVTKPSLQYWATLSATLCILTSAMHYGWPSPSIPKLLDGSHLQVTNEESSWIAVMPLIAAIFGAIFAGTLLDSIGRKNTILITGFPYIVSWLMIAYSTQVEIMYAARFLAGIADGFAFTAVPMYLGEIADPSIRGLLGSSCSVSMIIGILIINGLGLYLSIFATALISTIFPILLMVTFWFMPESPYFFIMKDKMADAKVSLQKFKGLEQVDWELSRLKKSVKEELSSAGRFLDLFTVASNRKAVLIMIGLRTVQQLSGITAITFYTQTIFDEGGGDSVPSETTTVIYYVVQLLITCISSLTIDKAGRKPLMLISTCGTALCLLVEGVYFYLDQSDLFDLRPFSCIPIIALIGFIISYSIGLGTIPVLMLGELFPTNVKAFAICLADVYFSIIAALVSKFFQMMKDHFGMYVPFFCFTLCCLLGLVFVVISLPETKGKTLEEIQDQLKGIQRNEEDDNSDIVT